MPSMTYHDLLAGIFAIVLLLAIVILAFVGNPIPDFLTGAFGIVVGYVFSRGGAVATAKEVAKQVNGQVEVAVKNGISTVVHEAQGGVADAGAAN